MRPLLVILALAASPSPAPSAEARLAAELAAELVRAHHCNAMAMDKREADPLAALLDAHHAPVVEIRYCGAAVEKLKSGVAMRSWPYSLCPLPGKYQEPPAPGAVTCKDHCCDVEHSARVCFDGKTRIRLIQLCAR